MLDEEEQPDSRPLTRSRVYLSEAVRQSLGFLRENTKCRLATRWRLITRDH